jgi:hypothetical protein
VFGATTRNDFGGYGVCQEKANENPQLPRRSFMYIGVGGLLLIVLIVLLVLWLS